MRQIIYLTAAELIYNGITGAEHSASNAREANHLNGDHHENPILLHDEAARDQEQ